MAIYNALQTNIKKILVYNIFVDGKSEFREIISGQVNDIIKFGLLEEVDLYVTATVTVDNFKHKEQAKKFISTVCEKAKSVEFFSENRFEYFGIRKVWYLAQIYHESIILYFHTKGISQKSISRNSIERILTSHSFKEWKLIIDIFHQNPEINKIGLFPSENSGSNIEPWGGWVWYNFWWARGSYITRCPKPEISENRYYYESWLGLANNVSWKDDCFSLISFNKKYFSARDANNGAIALSFKNIKQIETVGNNISLKKQTYQSSVYELELGTTISAVCGVKDGGFGFHTKSEDQAWWLIDLGEISNFDEIIIYNRLDYPSKDRSRFIGIFISDNMIEWEKIYQHTGLVFGGVDGFPLRIKTHDTKSRFVKLQNDNNDFFHLDEVEIYRY